MIQKLTLWELSGWKFSGTHLLGLLTGLAGFVMLFAAPEVQCHAWMLLIFIGALGVTAGQTDAGILRRLERLEKAQAAATKDDAPGRRNRGRGQAGAGPDKGTA